MSHYQRLLLIMRPMLHQAVALEQAVALARSASASLHIVALLESLDKLWLLESGKHQAEREAYRLAQHEQLEAQANALRASGVQVTTEVAWSNDLQDDILQHVLEMQPDLLLKQVEHEPALKRAFFTPLDWQLLRHCPVPVYLLGASQPALPRQIVAAVDVADTSPEGKPEMTASSSRPVLWPCRQGRNWTCCTPAICRWPTWAIWGMPPGPSVTLPSPCAKRWRMISGNWPNASAHHRNVAISCSDARSRCSAHTSNHSRWRYWSWGGPSHGDWTVCSAVPPNMCCTRYLATSWWCRNVRMTTPWAGGARRPGRWWRRCPAGPGKGRAGERA